MHEAGLELQNVTTVCHLQEGISSAVARKAALWTQEGHWLDERVGGGGAFSLSPHHHPKYYSVTIQAYLCKMVVKSFFQGTELDTREEDEVQSFCPWV